MGMFEMTLSGCWPNYVRPLVDNVSHWFAVYFIIYVSWVVFAVTRIITAIFLKSTMDNQLIDDEVMASGHLRQKEKCVKRLAKLFQDADTSGDGLLSLDEMECLLADDHAKTWLQTLGLEVYETKQLFSLLDDGDGAITIDEFLTGI